MFRGNGPLSSCKMHVLSFVVFQCNWFMQPVPGGQIHVADSLYALVVWRSLPDER